MNQIRLGATDVQVSEMGIGGWSWGEKILWGYGKGYTESDIDAAIVAALDAGINFIDTAQIYGSGRSETILGASLRKNKLSAITATKFMPFPWLWRQSNVGEALRRSLDRLQLDRVDLYQMHQPLPPMSPEHWMEAMAGVVKAGLTRLVGVSNYDADWTRRAHRALAHHGIPLASNQLKYSLLDRHIERNGTLQACQELNVTVIAYSPQEQGLLTGKYTPVNPLPGLRGRLYSRNYVERIQPLIGLMREIGQAHGNKTPGQVALNWTICKGTLPIPGVKNVRQMQENAGGTGWRLTSDEMAALEKASDPVQKKTRKG